MLQSSTGGNGSDSTKNNRGVIENPAARREAGEDQENRDPDDVVEQPGGKPTAAVVAGKAAGRTGKDFFGRPTTIVNGLFHNNIAKTPANATDAATTTSTTPIVSNHLSGTQKQQQQQYTSCNNNNNNNNNNKNINSNDTPRLDRGFSTAAAAAAAAGAGVGVEVGDQRVWISYHEGYSNAVRKPIRMGEFLASFQ